MGFALLHLRHVLFLPGAASVKQWQDQGTPPPPPPPPPRSQALSSHEAQRDISRYDEIFRDISREVCSRTIFAIAFVGSGAGAGSGVLLPHPNSIIVARGANVNTRLQTRRPSTESVASQCSCRGPVSTSEQIRHEGRATQTKPHSSTVRLHRRPMARPRAVARVTRGAIGGGTERKRTRERRQGGGRNREGGRAGVSFSSSAAAAGRSYWGCADVAAT
eukprot:SAG31_NODE_311_length_17866_cov_7.010750_12_plen_219_part_00